MSNRQFTEKEKSLTEKNLKVRYRELNDYEEQKEINLIKQDFIQQQRDYQDSVQDIEQKQETRMFEKTIRLLQVKSKKNPEDEELAKSLEYNEENFERIRLERKFTIKWTPYLRDKVDKQNNEINKELDIDIKVTKEVIEIAEDQLLNGVETKVPVGVN